VKVCGVAMAMLSGVKAGASLIDRFQVNVGTAHGRPSTGHPARPGAGPLPTGGRGWGGGPVVVRARERRAHGEGDQQVGSKEAGMPGGRR